MDFILKIVFLTVLLNSHLCKGAFQSKFHQIYGWRKFAFNDLPKSEYAKIDGYNFYNSSSIIPTAISYHNPTGCFFMAIPRRAHGIPATIAYINAKTYHATHSPQLRGYPTYYDNFVPGWFGVDNLADDDYKHNIYPQYANAEERVSVTHTETEYVEKDEEKTRILSHNSTIGQTLEASRSARDLPNSQKTPSFKDSYHFVSIYNTKVVAQCSRHFVIDIGTLQYPEGNVVIRRPILWAFAINGCNQDVLKDLRPILKVTIPDRVVNDATALTSITVDVLNGCNDFMVYITNFKDNSIIVYDNTKRTFWTFKHETFEPGAEKPYLYDSSSDPFNAGVLGLTIGSKTYFDYRDVFYTCGSSFGLYRTTTDILRNKTASPGDPRSSDFMYIGYLGPSILPLIEFDVKSEVLFIIHIRSNTLTCWNTNKQLNKNNVGTLFTDLQYGTDLFIDGERNIWFMLLEGTSEIVGEEVIFSDYYYRIYRANIDDIIKGTICEN